MNKKIHADMPLENQLAEIALEIGFDIRKKVNSTPSDILCSIGTSKFKGPGAKNADILGEELTIDKLTKYSNLLPYQIIVILDPANKAFLQIGKNSDRKIWTYADSVDGTIKLAGLGNEISDSKSIYRLGNDGVWGAGLAFTRPTTKNFEDLTIGDFEISAIVDGNPSRWPNAPTNAYTKLEGNVFKTYERAESSMNQPAYNGKDRQLYTSTQKKISQGVINFSDFQGFDRKTRIPGTEEFGFALREILADKNEKGAFDIWNMYGTFGSILRNMINYGPINDKSSYEPQGIANIWLNDALSNTIPPYAIVKGSGGFVTNEEGIDVGTLKLVSGRPHVFYSANENVKNYLVECAKDVRYNLNKK